MSRLNAAGIACEQPWAGVSATDDDINHADGTDAIKPSLTSIGGIPYVAWLERDGATDELRVARLNTTTNAWEEPSRLASRALWA